MHEGFKRKRTVFWFAADVILRNFNEIETEETWQKGPPPIKIRKSRRVLYSPFDDKDLATSFFSDRIYSIEKAWTNHSVSQYTRLRHIEKSQQLTCPCNIMGRGSHTFHIMCTMKIWLLYPRFARAQKSVRT